MKGKTYTHGITFFVSAQMYMDIRKVSDELKVGVSDFLRELIKDYLEKRNDATRRMIAEPKTEEKD